MRYNCDYRGTCFRKPYVEVFPSKKNENSEWKTTGTWNYLCFWHFWKERIRRFFGKVEFWWCNVDTDRETLENILEELWGIQDDLWKIKKKLGIKEKKIDLKKIKVIDDEETDVYKKNI